jgi:hypothetical protein
MDIEGTDIGMYLIQFAHNTVQRFVLLKTVMNFWVPSNAGYLVTSLAIISF